MRVVVFYAFVEVDLDLFACYGEKVFLVVFKFLELLLNHSNFFDGCRFLGFGGTAAVSDHLLMFLSYAIRISSVLRSASNGIKVKHVLGYQRRRNLLKTVNGVDTRRLKRALRWQSPIDFFKRLRHVFTPAEYLMWQLIRNFQHCQAKFRRQHNKSLTASRVALLLCVLSRRDSVGFAIPRCRSTTSLRRAHHLADSIEL